jgi:hypothetical protein
MMRAAYVNLNTGIVQEIIIVNSLNDIVPENYKLVEIPLIEVTSSEEEKQLFDIIKEIDPTFVDTIPKEEIHINIGSTKWSEERGFYEE